MDLIKSIFKPLSERRSKKLGEAILNGEVDKARKLLEQGVENFKYIQMQPSSFGSGKEMVPSEVFGDPYRLAEKVKIPNQQNMLKLLQQYNYGPDKKPNVAPGTRLG